MSGRTKIFLGFSLVLLITLIFLQCVKKEVFVVAEIEASSVAFNMEEDVSNFLSINNEINQINKIKVASYSKAKLFSKNSSNNDILDTIEIIPNSNDVTEAVSFRNVNAGIIDLYSSNNIDFTSVRENNQTVLAIKNFSQNISLQPRSNQIQVQLDNSAFTNFQPKNDTINVADLEPIIISPLLNEIKLRFFTDSNTFVRENNAFSISHVKFIVSDINKIRSTILGGSVFIEEQNKTVQLARNTSFLLDSTDQFTVTQLISGNGIIKLRIEGFTKGLKIGQYGNKYIPSMLEYLSKNNQVLLLFNSFMVVLTFILFISKEIKQETKPAKRKSTGRRFQNNK